MTILSLRQFRELKKKVKTNLKNKQQQKKKQKTVFFSPPIN